MNFLLLSVHYRHPELLADQIARLELCAGPVRDALGARLVLVPILHRWASRETVDAVLAAGSRHGSLVEPVDLRDLPPEAIPEELCHGHSLAEAYRRLRAAGRIGGEDLVAALDHDAHPLHAGTFARLGARLLGSDAPAGIGIPQWHRGHCFLHPSLLVTRAQLVDAMGEDCAFRHREPARNGRAWSDTCEGFTIWCEQNGRAILPLRVLSTGFPWKRWDSDMVPGRGTELTGWHGEPVRVGYLMRYGLEPEVPLVSHVWAGPLGPYREWFRFGDQTQEEVLAAYRAEPLAGAASGPRILYDCPDWQDEPTGGILCIYRHVEALRRRGFPAWVLHGRPGARARWFPNDAPILSWEAGEGPRRGDFLVVPEGSRHLTAESSGQPWTVDVFAQGFGFCPRLEPGESWRSLGVRGVMAVSRPVQRFVRRTMGMASTLIRPSLDLTFFRPGPKRLQIACMPRKHSDNLRQITIIFRLLHPEYRSVPFVPIDGEPHPRVAEILAESAVFLATGYPEGFGLPPLEAMACGCLVVGFSGGGGREYMRHGKNCLMAADGDVLTAARHLGAAIRAFVHGEEGEIRERARRTAEEFSPQAEEEALARYWLRRMEEEPRAEGTRRAPSRRAGSGERLVVLSVHYLYPELLADQIARLRPCARPLARELGLALRFHPVVHRSSRDDVVRTAVEATHGRGEFRVRALDLRACGAIPRGAGAHGHSLAAAFRLLRREEALGDGDLVAVLDHDAHPVHVRMLADLGAALLGASAPLGSAAPAAVGIPQWQRGHCYLHPSLLLTRVETIDRIGPEAAFLAQARGDPDGDDWLDTSEAFTVWCEAHRLPLLPLRVTSTAFPWSRWDSDMVPGGGTELTGWHGEAVRVGHLMGYGLLPGLPLASHLWAGPADPARRRGFSDHTWDELLGAYLAEPLEDRAS